MIDEFTVKFKSQREWGYLILFAFYFGGIGAGLFLVSLLLNFKVGAVVGILIVALGKNTAHLLFLGRWERFWRMFSQPLTSWISRGIYFVVAFLVFGALYLAPSFQWFTWLPWTDQTILGKTFEVLAVISALAVIIYTGFVMSYSPSIAFWNTTLLPIIFAFYALMGGTGAIFAMLPFVGEGTINTSLLESLEILLIVSSLLLIFVYVSTMSYSTIAAKESVQLLIRGRLSLHFLGGVILLGLLIPLSLATYTYFNAVGLLAVSGILAFAGLLELTGGFLFRYTLLKAGTYAPVI